MFDENIERDIIAYVIGVDSLDDGQLGPFGYWYDGAPEWCSREVEEKAREMLGTPNVALATGVESGGGFLPYPEPTFVDADGETWSLIEYYHFSGERECPFIGTDYEADASAPIFRDGVCLYCEGKPGNHGHVFIGEGYEAIYARRNDA